MDIRIGGTPLWLAMLAQSLVALVALTAGFLLVPALSVLAGAQMTATISLMTATALHVLVTAVFAAAMRRLDASAATCVVNLFLAVLPVVALGVLLGWLGAGAPGSVTEGAASNTDVLQQVGLQLGWAALSVIAGVALGLLWVRAREGAAA